MDLTKPIQLKSARAWRTYIGGKQIEELHGKKDAPDTNFPEEWLMSTVRARNAGREDIVEGLSYTLDGDIPLSDIAGDDLGVLVKLIDSAERLTVQVHPTKKKAKELFNSEYGKTECWHILGTRVINGERPCIYLGFKKGITRELWQRCFEEQDIPAMLECLHKIDVNIGDTYLIKGGVPHAIGCGCFLTEIQEPTDYTIRTERVTPSGLKVADFMCHQGLGFDKMFDCFDYTGMDIDEVLAKYKLSPKKSGGTETLVDYTDTEMFKMELITVLGPLTVPASSSFSGMYVIEGEGTLCGKAVKRSDQFFLPAECREFTMSGNMKVLRYYGPYKGDKK